MFYLNRRDFCKKFIFFPSTFYIGFIFPNFFLNDYSNKFICENFYLMGTNGKIQIFSDNLDYAKFLIKKALAKIKELENCLTKFSPYSDIGRINSNKNNYTIISNDTSNVLDIGNNISKLTYGYFDMGLGNLLSYFGIDKLVPMVGDVTKISDINNELLLKYGNAVKIQRNNSMLDLGGIGKGYALDECMKIFLNSGIKHIAIEFGGDINVFGGMPDFLPWEIRINNNINFTNINSLKIKTGSIAISSSLIKRSKINNYHHIINPYSLSSNNDYSFLIVKGNSSAICDALSTACFNMNLDNINLVFKSFEDFEVLPFY